jgi:hypothetical protein
MSWRDAVDERLIARCEAHVGRGERLTRDFSVPINLREARTHLDPAQWGTGFVRVEGEYQIPTQLQTDLHEVMPQALLRDLYRPVHEPRWIERELVEGTGDRGPATAMRLVRAARTRPELPRIEPAMRTVRAFQTWRRAFLAERWQDAVSGLGTDKPPAR